MSMTIETPQHHTTPHYDLHLPLRRYRPPRNHHPFGLANAAPRRHRQLRLLHHLRPQPLRIRIRPLAPKNRPISTRNNPHPRSRRTNAMGQHSRTRHPGRNRPPTRHHHHQTNHSLPPPRPHLATRQPRRLDKRRQDLRSKNHRRTQPRRLDKPNPRPRRTASTPRRSSHRRNPRHRRLPHRRQRTSDSRN